MRSKPPEEHIERIHALGRMLRTHRARKGETQQAVSQRAEVAQTLLSRLESGHTDDFALKLLPKLATGYGLPIIELLEIVYPDVGLEKLKTEVVSIELKPPRAFEARIEDLRQQMVTYQEELDARLAQNQKETRAFLRKLQRMVEGSSATEQEAFRNETREALAMVMSAVGDFSAWRETEISMSSGRQGRIPSPLPIPDEDAVD